MPKHNGSPLNRTRLIAFAVLAASFGIAAAAWASFPFKTFPAPVPKSSIHDLVVANDEVYFLAYGNGDGAQAYVGHAAATGPTDVVRSFAPEGISGLAASPDGALSVLHAGSHGTDAVYRFQPGGNLTTVPVPVIRDPGSSGSRPIFTSIVACNDKEVWLAPGGTGRADVVKLGLDGKARVYRRKGVVPDTLACGPEGTVWFTALRPPTKSRSAGHFEIGRISASGKLRLFRLPTKGVGPKPVAGPIVQGPGGVMWFGSSDRKRLRGGKEQDHDYVGRITPAGRISLSRVSPKIAGPNDTLACIAAGPDRHIWLGFSGAGIARANKPGKLEKVSPTRGDCQMVADFRGNLWFGHGHRVGRLRP